MRSGALACGLVLVLSGCSHQSSNAPAASPAKTEVAPAKLKPPPHLSETARAVIAERMQNHGEEMTMLLWSILFSDYENVQRISGMIATEPRLTRPFQGEEASLNAQLPPEFFDLQDALDRDAKSLLALAQAPQKDGAELAKAYGQLASTCVRCHQVYLEEPKKTDE